MASGPPPELLKRLEYQYHLGVQFTLFLPNPLLSQHNILCRDSKFMTMVVTPVLEVLFSTVL